MAASSSVDSSLSRKCLAPPPPNFVHYIYAPHVTFGRRKQIPAPLYIEVTTLLNISSTMLHVTILDSTVHHHYYSARSCHTTQYNDYYIMIL